MQRLQGPEVVLGRKQCAECSVVWCKPIVKFSEKMVYGAFSKGSPKPCEGERNRQNGAMSFLMYFFK